MAYRWKPKNATLDPDSPRAWGQCDRCGFIYDLHQLQWQMSYSGTSRPQNRRILVCPNHLDPLNPQDAPTILTPDPVPVMNARTGASTADADSYLSTQDDDILTTESGVNLITTIPDPGVDGSTSNLFCTISAPGADLSTLYLDLFDGDPSTTGRSVLSAITGSSTRTDIASLLATVSGVATNPAAISIATASASQTNISYAGLYSASISGALLMSGEVSVSRVIAEGNPVRFNSLGLTINTV